MPAMAQSRIALTFDDLPYQGGQGGRAIEPDPASWQLTTQLMLDALSAAQAPAMVFVNCGALDDDDKLVSQWRDAGHTIGNHTAHHLSAADGDLDHWMSGVRQCDGLWSPGSGLTRWFRFPYLRRGETVERRDAVLGALKSAGYTTVPATADSLDWLFEFYRRQLISVEASEDIHKRIVQRYVQHVTEAVVEASRVSVEKLGRDIPHIALFHVNDITAQALPEILRNLQRNGVEFIDLAQAMSDPVYAEADAWVGPYSRMWLGRTAPTQRPDGSSWYRASEASVRVELEALLTEFN